MQEYTVWVVQSLSASVRVMAEDPDDAIDKAFRSNDMPSGTLCYHCSQHMDASGYWEPVSVEVDGKEVWSDRKR